MDAGSGAGSGRGGGGSGSPCDFPCNLVPWPFQTILYMGTSLSPARSLLHHPLGPFHCPFSANQILLEKVIIESLYHI